MSSAESILHIPFGRVSDSVQLDKLNWPKAFPYKPEVSFRIGHTGDAILLQYTVEEQSVRALASVPGQQVYEDSCVEFFLQPDPADPHYYNFEWNAAGTLYLAWRTGRADPEEAPAEVLRLVKFCCGHIAPVAEHRMIGPWGLDLLIPAAALWHNPGLDFKGLHARGNFYKCGDGLKVPHYVTWAPIATEKPDYHRPEFFGELFFE